MDVNKRKMLLALVLRLLLLREMEQNGELRVKNEAQTNM